METAQQLFSPAFLQAVGMVVVVVAVVFGRDLLKSWSYHRNGTERRNTDRGIDTNRLLDLMEKSIKATHDVAQELKHNNETMRDLTEGMNRRSDKALNQHQEILNEISILDVPRRIIGR